MLTTTSLPRVLIADDQPDLLDALRLLLKGQSMQMDAVSSPDAVVAALQGTRYDVLLMDLNYTGDTTSGREGMNLLAEVRRLDPLLPVIAMTGWGSVDLAVETMRGGVRDFVQKPWDNLQLLATLRAEIERGRAERMRHAESEREMAEARRIQRQLLPSSLPDVDGWEVATAWQPASGVAGDCFDLLPFGRTRLGISVADVVGKGIPAALLMSNLQAAVRAFASAASMPAELCQQVNRILCGHIAEGRFISFCYCTLETTTGLLSYANAGHCPPLLLHADGSVERLGRGGPVLGIVPAASYEQDIVTTHSGDRLVLYTDGITEARNERDEEFGEARLIDLALEHRACSAPALQARLTDAVAGFTGGRFQDDATLVVLACD